MTDDHANHLDTIQEQSKCWSKLLNKIEHDVFNKLATIRMTNKSLQELLPILFKAYQIALEHKLIENEIHPNDITNYHEKNFGDMEPVLLPLFNFYDSVHEFVKEIVSTHKYSKFSAVTAVNAIIDSLEVRNNIRLNADNDFSFSFSDLFIKALFNECFNIAFNRLKNPENTRVNIGFSNHDAFNSIHCDIINPNITEDAKNYMDLSLVTQNSTTTPSFNVCRLALMNSGGDITCQITPGKAMEFIFSFPRCV